ncbi:MAG: hypothetical protein EAZ53_02125 [Bacteroidetes bacterium]|nr:MAG: hypothetical protein EAZ53_02125 [Bacteroidota bacterium]
MKKDIQFPKVEGISIAVIRKVNELQHAEWQVVLLNNNSVFLENVIVVSRGYGEIDGVFRQSSVLRHVFERIEPNTNVIIEPIDLAVFVLNNEYWVSYYIGNEIFDKRFTFVPETITEQNLIKIPNLGLMGVLHE